MSDFKKFSALVHAQFTEMSKHELFVVGIDRDELYEHYLAAFPEGTNPIFRERTEHDCSCCRQFIKNIGNVVAIIDGKLVPVWDVVGAEAPYDTVATALANTAKSFPIISLFRSAESSYGAETSRELRADGTVHNWNHFHGSVAAKHRTQDVGKVVGDYSTSVGVFKRALAELKTEALLTVIDLIKSNSLYRGEENLQSVMGFFSLQKTYFDNQDQFRENYIWANAGSRDARFRNTAIGTLVVDLSDGMPLELAVKAFETKVAPQNYKRTTALITPGMIKDAMKTINDLGLQPALERRFARLSDVSVNNVLWVDGSVASKMKDGIEGLLLGAVKPQMLIIDAKKAEDISIADFMVNVLPKALTIDMVVANSHQGNFVSLTAPVHDAVPQLFKWNNDFAWSYDGNITDSIKERVKAAGGTVEGDLCCRLAWEYTDDLDLHMYEPGGHHINFSNRRRLSPNGGMLDLDANGIDGQRDDPSENIFYTDRRKMRDGVYELRVNNYRRRSTGVGFEIEIEFDGQVHRITYDKVMRAGETRSVAKIRCTKGVFEVIESLPVTAGAAKVLQKWGVATETLTKVSTIMFSPNYWDDNVVGNKHWFFMLEGCKNDMPTRGIYNEFLSSKLEAHRKVFEVLGDKTKCQPTDDQLSGVGFSSTKRDSVLVSVTGDKLRKAYNINF